VVGGTLNELAKVTNGHSFHDLIIGDLNLAGELIQRGGLEGRKRTNERAAGESSRRGRAGSKRESSPPLSGGHGLLEPHKGGAKGGGSRGRAALERHWSRSRVA
jgi:hypothetical protein